MAELQGGRQSRERERTVGEESSFDREKCKAMRVATLPNELWEIIISYLPEREVCRLRALNRIFFYNALRIHYGFLQVTQMDWRLPKQKMRHLSQVRSLEFISGSSKKCGRNASVLHWMRLRLFERLMKRLSHQVSQPIQHLTFRYPGIRFPCSAHLDVAWRNFCTTIVSLTIDITNYTLGAKFPPLIYCPNVRKLDLTLFESLRILPPSPSNTVDGLFRLIPNHLEHFALDFAVFYLERQVFEYLRPSHKFVHLRTFRFVGFPFTNPPVELNQLIRSNISTLRNLQICHWIPVSQVVPIKFVPSFGHLQLTSLCIQVEGLRLLDHGEFIRELSHCSNLISFEFAGCVDGSLGIHDLLDALCTSSTSLRCFKFQVIHLTYEDFPSILVEIGRCLPNLNCLAISIFNYRLSGQTGDYLETRWRDDGGHLVLHYNGLMLPEVADAGSEMIMQAFEECVGHIWQTEIEFPVSLEEF